MNLITRTLGSFIVLALLLVSRGEAASVQYLLDQSNTLADDIDYLLVTISDGVDGQLDFLVETQPALEEMAGTNFGIAAFGFLLSSPMQLGTDDFLLPDGWKAQFDKGMSEAGKFDVRLLGTGSTRQDPLHFSVLGLTLSDILPGFASHVAGFTGAMDDHKKHDSSGSAFFYGDTLVTAVPVPAALWLFGSGLLFLGGMAKRRRG